MSILLKRNNVSGVAPLESELVPGEIALNTADGALYTKKEDGSVVLLAYDSSLPAPVTVPWSSIINEPVDFPPSAHTHSPSDITGTAVITTDPRLSNNRDPNPHSHDWYSLDITNKPLIDNNGDNWRFVAPASAGSVEMISHSANYFVRVSEGAGSQTVGTLVQGPISITNSGNTGVNGSIKFPDNTVQTTAYTGLEVHTHATSDITGLDGSIQDLETDVSALQTDVSTLQTDVSDLETGKQDAGDYALASHQHNKDNFNTSVGLNALKDLTTGNRNTAFGYDALSFNTVGLNNSAFGSTSLWQNTEGSHNVAIGAWSHFFNISGSDNTAVGTGSLAYNNNGFKNVAIGGACLYQNTTGIENTSVGAFAGDTNTTGSNNVIIGYAADISQSNLNNCIILGSNAVATQSNEFVLGSTASPINTALSVGAAGSANSLPSAPLGYLAIRLNGTLVKIPYYRE